MWPSLTHEETEVRKCKLPSITYASKLKTYQSVGLLTTGPLLAQTLDCSLSGCWMLETRVCSRPGGTVGLVNGRSRIARDSKVLTLTPLLVRQCVDLKKKWCYFCTLMRILTILCSQGLSSDLHLIMLVLFLKMHFSLCSLLSPRKDR